MRKICKKCKLIFKGTECPICHSTNLADGFRGKIIIIDPENSELAKKLNIKQKGEYAIKIK
ncbi:DNA-directed RNA polymerase subunit E'' [Candidatus Pacearchaeota archaeon CG_4_9_14_3_um_filter_31_7]|nr:MAG: DNA-directed RNA polymerase subunit E'' [Candidatus Pacearchaeota archaeon CG1_02_31_27]PIN92650.1 MAG: DNA-directed RNA polymerase subunit E'' [Candidatus Pacearchaeota archaeon CG10_big_fil_rev_8_21_14_0_10_31_59]PIZ81217.1 MAG: DNA-directed RNA polymerase subunit E'' [Candidatus Pacearchaeota archaeon CG_4_10_14_0_2_um_filter_31_10]PJA70933.1 MAG: DNA-directed RNA polymerase subunit E'' [Candidatus Pacearchaeota archaeon CG_4_9_14_3_um_filter_31_7]